MLLCLGSLAAAGLSTTALQAHLLGACSANGPAVCIIDGNNLRGAEVFSISQSELSTMVTSWSDEVQLPALLELDHGPEQRAWHVGRHAVLTQCGGGRTADDVIVRDAWWLRHELGRNVFVVTNDQGLIARVKRYRSPGGSVQVRHTPAFARLLGLDETPADDSRRRETTAQRSADAVELAAQLHSRTPAPPTTDDGDGMLARYVDWVNNEAPPSTGPFLDHTLSGVPPSPSLKRRLRRKRFKLKGA